MRINTNIASLTAQRNLANTTRAFARALERLSSGKRINRAGDDAAGLAISERIRADIKGYTRVAQNINDAFGYLNTAEAGLASQAELLQRMRELALQSANGTLSVEDRENLDIEFQDLLSEIDRIAEETQFNGNYLLNGSFTEVPLQVGTQKGEVISFGIEAASSSDLLTEDVERGTGSFSSQVIASTYERMTLGDIDEDGDLDLIANRTAGGVYNQIFLNTAGVFTASGAGWTLTGGTAPSELVDVNGDSHLDYLLTSGGNITLRLGNGNGTFQAVQTLASLTGSPADLQTGDLDGDGDLDIVVSGATVRLLFNDGAGTFSNITTITLGNSPAELELEDFDDDGDLDILTANWLDQTISALSNNGSGTFTSTQTIGTNGSAYGLDTADVNGDGHLDFVVVNSSPSSRDQARIYVGSGDGTFSLYSTCLVPYDADTVHFADMNGDGDLDLVTGSSNNSLSQISYGDGSGVFGASGSYSTFTGHSMADPADLNGDDFLDVVGNANSSYHLGVLLQGTAIVTDVPENRNILTQSNAQNILGFLDGALSAVADRRAAIGANMSRLEFAGTSVSVSAQNLSEAYSQMADADIAEETAELTRAQILQQAGVSVLGQANTSLQMVLGLLRF